MYPGKLYRTNIEMNCTTRLGFGLNFTLPKHSIVMMVKHKLPNPISANYNLIYVLYETGILIFPFLISGSHQESYKEYFIECN
jgi:hypothetical protein